MTVDPYKIFAEWYQAGVKTGLPTPEAASLATVSPEGKPSVRVVLFKGFQGTALTFYTNYESRKGTEIATNPHVAMVFHWSTLELQIRVEGVAGKMGREQSDAYFQTRPRGSQIGAWASQQSQRIGSAEDLERRVAQYEARFAGAKVPLPGNWGGYLVEPTLFEFWTGKLNRLHERIVYRRHGDVWQVERLAP